jgi:hypothetical protein
LKLLIAHNADGTGHQSEIKSIGALRRAVWAYHAETNHADDFDVRWASQAILTLWVTLSFNNLRYAEGISAELVECGALEDLSPYREHWFDTNVWGSIFDRCMWSVPNVILNRYVL